MTNRFISSMALTAVLTACGFSQTVGLSDQYFASLNITASNVLAQGQNYRGFTNPGGVLPTLSETYDTGVHTYNTAFGEIAYSDLAQFGHLEVTGSATATAGTAQDAGGQGHLQDIYGSTYHDFQGNQKNASFDDTFTVATATTLNFQLVTTLAYTSSSYGQGSTNLYGNDGFLVYVNGAYKTGAVSSTLFASGTDIETVSIALNAGDTADISAFLFESASASTYYSQGPSNGTCNGTMTSDFFVTSSNGAYFASGSGMKYQSVPEPAAWLGLLLPIGSLIARRKKA